MRSAIAKLRAEYIPDSREEKANRRYLVIKTRLYEYKDKEGNIKTARCYTRVNHPDSPRAMYQKAKKAIKRAKAFA